MKALAFLLALAAAGPAGATCRQALALGLDVSGSVDASEYRLQLEGLAAALAHPDVAAAILADPERPLALTVYEWGEIGESRRLVPWTDVTGPQVLAGIVATLRATERAVEDPATALGAAMLDGARMLAERPDCARWTLDISGDGPSNIGPHPVTIRRDDMPGITVNGLVIGPDSRSNIAEALSNVRTLEDYFRAFVVRGPGAFVETAADYADFEEAMVRKLRREIEGLPMSRAEMPDQ